VIITFPKAWLSVELKGFRDHPEPYRSYSPFHFDSLPSLPDKLFNGSYSWLPRIPITGGADTAFERLYPTVLAQLVEQAKDLQVVIPMSFVTFITNATLTNSVRSATNCGFGIAKRLVPVPWESGYLLRFMADSQGCLFWYLYLTKDSKDCVVVANQYYGGDPTSDREFMEKHLGPEWDREDPPKQSDKIWYCAPSFESFVYRFWIENEIWYSLKENGRPGTDDQKEYLQTYHQQ
jgi:hypothetical protein